MSSRNPPPPPITTTTPPSSSTAPSNFGQASSMAEESALSSPERSLMSPASRTFFDAISSKVRSRSRSPSNSSIRKSRSPTGTASPHGSLKVSKTRSRSRSPHPATAAASGPAAPPAPAPTKFSSTTALPISSSMSAPSSPRNLPAKRASAEVHPGSMDMRRLNSTSSSASERSQWERMTYGRHSTDWIFGGHSITGSFRSFLRRNDQQN